MPDKRVTELTAIDAVSGSDLVMVVDDPAGTPVNKKATQTQVLAPAAKLAGGNDFVGDQTIDGDLTVSGTITPSRREEQQPKIDQLIPKDTQGVRTLLSKSLVSGLALRHDEVAGNARITVGNYDTQVYEPLLTEAQSLQIKTGTYPPGLAEHVRVHPSGGVTVGDGADHDTAPGVGVVVARGLVAASASIGSLGNTPLDATKIQGMPGDASKFLNGTGGWTAPAGGGGGTGGVQGPAGAVEGNITAFADATGQFIGDSNVPVTQVARKDQQNDFVTPQVIHGTTPRLRLTDESQPVGSQVIEACNYNQQFYVHAADAAKLMFTVNRVGTLAVEGDVNAKGNVVPTGQVYPGRVDTPGAQGSWYLGSHGAYGLYTNTGFYINGSVTTPGTVTAGVVDVNGGLLYARQGLRVGLDPPNGTGLSTWLLESSNHIRAQGGVYDYGRSVPMGAWTDFSPAFYTAEGAPCGIVRWFSSRYQIVGNTMTIMLFLTVNIPAQTGFLYFYMPVGQSNVQSGGPLVTGYSGAGFAAACYSVTANNPTIYLTREFDGGAWGPGPGEQYLVGTLILSIG